MSLSNAAHRTTLDALRPNPHAAPIRDRALEACDRLLDHCVEVDFAGHDPYDGLAAQLAGTGLLKRSRFGRLVLIQAVRRSRLDLRPYLRIPRLVNPKTLALVMSACCDLYQATGRRRYAEIYEHAAMRVASLTSEGWSGACWGYPFDWQARSFFIPAQTPTVVCTSFVARGFLDGYRVFGDTQGLQLAKSACDFILRDLNRTVAGRTFCFSYSPLDSSVVHNASCLGAFLLTAVGHETGEASLIQAASPAFRFLVDHQQTDGSWVYGFAPHHQWTDALHTGFILECLAARAKLSPELRLSRSLDLGTAFYLEHLLVDGWRPRSFSSDNGDQFDLHTAGEALRIESLLPKQKLSTTNSRLLDLLLPTLNMRESCPDAWLRGAWKNSIRGGFMRWTRAWILSGLARHVLHTLSRVPGARQHPALLP